MSLPGWYGGRQAEIERTSATAVWYHTGLPLVPICWVVVRNPQGKFEPQAFLCTDLAATPEQILLWFRQRWQVEVTFEEVRAHLGVETQRQWSEIAILRTTPALFALFSLCCFINTSPATAGRLSLPVNGMVPKAVAHVRGCFSPCASGFVGCSTFWDIRVSIRDD